MADDEVAQNIKAYLDSRNTPHEIRPLIEAEIEKVRNLKLPRLTLEILYGEICVSVREYMDSVQEQSSIIDEQQELISQLLHNFKASSKEAVKAMIENLFLGKSLTDFKNKQKANASKGGNRRAANLKMLEEETIRLYESKSWKSVPLAALEITPTIVALSKKTMGVSLFPTTDKPLKWIRKHNKRKNELN